MEKNRWEPLHRLSTTQQIISAIFGGAAVNRLIQGALGLFTQPSLPWWGDLLIAVACSAVIVTLLIRVRKGRGTVMETPLEAPKASAAPVQTRPQTTPYLLTRYENRGGRQFLIFNNSGESSAQYIEVGSLEWCEQRKITVPNAIPPLAPKQHHECQMYFEEAPNRGRSLSSFMREKVESAAFVTIRYQDHRGNKFSQKVTLTATSKEGEVVWQSGPTVVVSLAGEP